MNPLNKYLKSYITVCMNVAVIYAFVVGFNLPVFVRIADGVGIGIVLFSTGFVLWNIFRFTIPLNNKPKFRYFFVIVLAFITSTLMTGIETLVLYLSFPLIFDVFFPTIPLRVFIFFLLFIIFFFYYEMMDNKGVIIEKTPIDLSQITKPNQCEPFNLPNSSTIQSVDRITVRSGQKIKIIPIDSILYIKADGDYVAIRTAEGSWLKEQTMKYTEEQLPINNFARIHRSYIVNIQRISRIERYGEKRQVVLSNNEKIIISAARYQTLKQILGI